MNQELDPRTRQLLFAPPFPLLVRLATPNALAFFVQATVSMAEVWYIGQLGKLSLAAIALVFPLLMLMQMMSAGAIGGAITASIARALGAGRLDQAANLLWHALAIALIGAITFLALFALLGRPFLQLLGGDGVVLEDAMRYCWILFTGAVFLWIMNIMSAAFRGMGNMRFPASVLVFGALVQVPLSGALILGWWGLPPLGIAGAAISTIAVGVINSFLMLARLGFGSVTVRLRLESLQFRRALFADIARVALPAMLSPLFTVITIMSLTALVGRFGPAALAGYGIGSRVEFLLIPLVFGLGAAMTSMVGTNVGAGNIQRAERIGWLGGGTAAALAGSVGLTLAVFPQAWVGLFTDDPATLASGVLYMQIVAPCFALQGLGLSLYFASQGAGRVGWPVMATLLRFALAVGGASVSILIFGGDLADVYGWAATGMVCYGIVTAGSLALGAWRR